MHAGAKTEEPVPVKDEFRIADEVIKAASNWALFHDTEHLRCWKCGQSVMSIRPTVLVTLADESGSLLAHLMQRHGWTRETPGESPHG
jgi:hypothetical protein